MEHGRGHIDRACGETDPSKKCPARKVRCIVVVRGHQLLLSRLRGHIRFDHAALTLERAFHSARIRKVGSRLRYELHAA